MTTNRLPHLRTRLLGACAFTAAALATTQAHAIFPDVTRTPDQIIDTTNQFPYVGA